ncbi:nucleotidyl transferase AbiEii/AbiGii toxin family protein [Shewanella algicola]|uniref:nucleotidyl transferase AbiEii/AbiGii toxin family protein n=1 Tax=Shewanella algicola TaxID=640633 RepID=UPI00249417A0|nr:nucleotidyl transferase AbiEii/AbiGii toxin family protein [Shewanella algicola]
MQTDQQDFETLVNLAMQDGAVSHMRAVVEKELLHYDILFALEKGGFLDELVFQGGTSLRLCYGGNRFSEDLDFAGGIGFSSHKLAQMKEYIELYVGNRYGLEVTVKEPKTLKEDPKYSELNIDKWQIAIVTAPDRRSTPKQRIKLEVANIPAYTKEPLPLQANYDFLPDGYRDMLVLTETLDEVMADKLVSLPATQKYVRNRDIWDLAWLKQQGAVVRTDLVAQKVADYKIAEAYNAMLMSMIERLPSLITGEEFMAEMKRFIPTDVFDRTLGQKKFITYLASSVVTMLKEVQSSFRESDETPEFKM